MRLRSCCRIAFQSGALAALTASTPKTRREAAKASGILIGTDVRHALHRPPAYASSFAAEFNLVEPEDAMKWWTVRPTADNLDFAGADEIVRFAQVHDMKVRGHCRVWDHNNPKWLADGQFSPAQWSRLFQEHTTTEMKHYAGKSEDSIGYNQPAIGLSDRSIACASPASTTMPGPLTTR